jgi:hypothetical protein
MSCPRPRDRNRGRLEHQTVVNTDVVRAIRQYNTALDQLLAAFILVKPEQQNRAPPNAYRRHPSLSKVQNLYSELKSSLQLACYTPRF